MAPWVVGTLTLILIVTRADDSHQQQLQRGDMNCPDVCMCDGGFVKCADEGLDEVPSPLPQGTVHLLLPGNRFGTITRTEFKRTKVESSLEVVSMENCGVKEIGDGAFGGMSKLRELYLLSNNITRLSPRTFTSDGGGLSKLEVLDLSRNEIVSLASGAFAQLGALTSLRLWDNRLKRLDPGVFIGLQNLRSLMLGDNPLQEVPTESFGALEGLEELQMLNLPAITRISRGAFLPLANLNKIHITNWSSPSSPLIIDEEGFAGLSNLVYLSLRSSNLDHIPHQALQLLPNLKHLNLGDNPITSLKSNDFDGLDDLEELHLDRIGEQRIQESPFQHLGSLKTLDISHNHLQVIPNHLFFALHNVTSLNMSHNRIERLSDVTVDPLSKLREMDVRGNPLICDCQLKWLHDHWENRIREGFSLMGTCANPDSYAGYGLTAVTGRRFECVPPSFDAPTRDHMTWLHHTVSLACHVTRGNPQPDIAWDVAFDEEENQNKKVNEKGELVISKIKESDFHGYTCVASNDHGIAKHDIILVDSHHHTPLPDDDSNAEGHKTAAIVVITAVGLSALMGMVCYRRKTHLAIRRSLTSFSTSNKQAYSHF